MDEPILVETPSHQALVPITDAVQARIRAAGWQDGAVHLFCEHTTCGLLINENADPDVARDLLDRLGRLVPWDDPRDRHAEGNTAAHLRAVLVGCDLTVPVRRGRLALGTWQGIFLAEFDGPRRRRVRVTFLGGAEGA